MLRYLHHWNIFLFICTLMSLSLVYALWRRVSQIATFPTKYGTIFHIMPFRNIICFVKWFFNYFFFNFVIQFALTNSVSNEEQNKYKIKMFCYLSKFSIAIIFFSYLPKECSFFEDSSKNNKISHENPLLKTISSCIWYHF